jgi:hypothetical protein
MATTTKRTPGVTARLPAKNRRQYSDFKRKASLTTLLLEEPSLPILVPFNSPITEDFKVLSFLLQTPFCEKLLLMNLSNLELKGVTKSDSRKPQEYAFNEIRRGWLIVRPKFTYHGSAEDCQRLIKNYRFHIVPLRESKKGGGGEELDGFWFKPKDASSAAARYEGVLMFGLLSSSEDGKTHQLTVCLPNESVFSDYIPLRNLKTLGTKENYVSSNCLWRDGTPYLSFEVHAEKCICALEDQKKNCLYWQIILAMVPPEDVVSQRNARSLVRKQAEDLSAAHADFDKCFTQVDQVMQELSPMFSDFVTQIEKHQVALAETTGLTDPTTKDITVDITLYPENKAQFETLVKDYPKLKSACDRLISATNATHQAYKGRIYGTNGGSNGNGASKKRKKVEEEEKEKSSVAVDVALIPSKLKGKAVRPPKNTSLKETSSDDINGAGGTGMEYTDLADALLGAVHASHAAINFDSDNDDSSSSSSCSAVSVLNTSKCTSAVVVPE